MHPRLTRIIAIVVFALLALTWIFRNDAPTDPAPTRIPTPQKEAPVADIRQRPSAYNYADAPDKVTTSTSTSTYEAAPTGFPMFHRKTPYAYVFYATSDEMACSVIINIRRLQSFHAQHRIFALISKKVNKGYRDSMEELNVTVSVTEPPKHPHARNVPKEKEMLKLMAFNMHHTDSSLKRVVVIDPNQIIYKPLDSLFSLPSADLAAPRAYWKGNHFLSTNLMLISLSDRLWKQVDEGIKKMKESWYDFELINDLFESSALVLPGQYAMIDDHFVDWTTATWYRPEGDVHSDGAIKEYSKATMQDLWDTMKTWTKPQSDDKPQKVVEAEKEPASPPAPAKDLKKLRKRGEADEVVDISEPDLGDELTPDHIKKEQDKARKADQNPPSTDDDTESNGPPQQPKAEPPKQQDPEPSSEEVDKQRQAAEAQRIEAQKKAAEDATRRRQQQEAAEKAKQLKAAAAQPPPHPYTANNHPNRGPLHDMFKQAILIRYGRVLSPWEKDYEAYKNDKPKMHPEIYEMHKLWREEAQLYCPRVFIEPPEDSRHGDLTQPQAFHFVNNV